MEFIGLESYEWIRSTRILTFWYVLLSTAGDVYPTVTLLQPYASQGRGQLQGPFYLLLRLRDFQMDALDTFELDPILAMSAPFGQTDPGMNTSVLDPNTALALAFLDDGPMDALLLKDGALGMPFPYDVPNGEISPTSEVATLPTLNPVVKQVTSQNNSASTASKTGSSTKGHTRRPSNQFVNKDGKLIRGKPCIFAGGCNRRAQSGGLCKAHGGGVRCNVEGCTKSSQGNGRCRTHGGGKRCSFEGCTKGTQRGGFCYLHGGVRTCSEKGCSKKDRGSGKCIAHTRATI